MRSTLQVGGRLCQYPHLYRGRYKDLETNEPVYKTETDSQT